MRWLRIWERMFRMCRSDLMTPNGARLIFRTIGKLKNRLSPVVVAAGGAAQRLGRLRHRWGRPAAGRKWQRAAVAHAGEAWAEAVRLPAHPQIRRVRAAEALAAVAARQLLVRLE